MRYETGQPALVVAHFFMSANYDQTKGELCEKCGWAMKFPEEPCRCELERENAALRTVLKRWLKVADDCHQEQQKVGYSEYNITAGLMVDTRALLDAARKEAQP